MSMLHSNPCRLCINICHEHRSLYDEDGRRNEVYALTDKYFTPLLLNMECVDHDAVICLECWRHIFEFHTYQQSVLLAQQKFVANKRIAVVVKSEVENQLDVAEFKTRQTTSIGPNARRHNTVRSGGNAALGSEDYTNATTWIFSHVPEVNANLQSETVVKSEVEGPQNNRGNHYSIKDLPDEQAEAVVKSELEGNDFCADDQPSVAVVKLEIDDQLVDDGVNDSCGDDNSDIQSECIVKSEVEYIEYIHGSDYMPRDREVSLDEDNTDEQSESDGSVGCYSSDDEMPLAVGTSRVKSKQKMDNPMDQGCKTNVKRPETVQEYDRLIAQWRPNLECVICSEVRSSFSLLQLHFDKQHPTEKCHIVCCQNKFYHRYELEKHIHYHTEPKAFKCVECYIGYMNVSSLQGHMRRVHSGKPKAKQPPTKRRKKTSHTADNSPTLKPGSSKGHTCEECGKVYQLLSSLRRHKRKFHLGISKIATIKCTVCDKAYNNPQSLREHMSSHAGKHMFSCTFCPKTFIYSSGLYEHLNKMHGQEWEEKKKEKAKLFKPKEKKTYKCAQCDKVFKRQPNLREHQALHEGKVLYKCSYCPKTYNYRTNFQDHLKKKHSEERQKKKKH